MGYNRFAGRRQCHPAPVPLPGQSHGREPGGLQSMGSLRVGHDWATSFSLFTFMHWRRKRQPTPVFLPGESQGRGAWWAAVYGVAQSRTRLKRLSSSSNRFALFSFCWSSESTIRTHISFSSSTSLHPPSEVITKHWFELSVIHSSFPLATRLNADTHWPLGGLLWKEVQKVTGRRMW